MTPLLHQGIEHHQAGRLAEAQRIYRQVLEQNPHDADAMHLLGVVAGQAGQDAEAIEWIGRAIAARPETAAFHANLAEFLRRSGQPEKAVDECRRAIALEENLPAAYNNLGLGLCMLGNSPEAITAFERAIELHPQYGQAYSNLGNLLRESGRLTEAIAACRRGVELMPGVPEPHNSLGIALQRSGQFDAAIAEFSEALRIAPDYFEACYNLGLALREGGQWERACAVCRKAVEMQPTSPDAHDALGLALHDVGDCTAAQEQFQKALELDPRHAPAHSHLGITLADLGQLDAAAEHCLQAIQLQEKSAELETKGDTTLYVGRAYSPTTLHENGGRVRPPYIKHAEMLNNLGVVLKRRGDLDAAAAAFERSLELNARSAQTCANLGNVWRDAGEPRRAIEWLRRAVELAPQDAALHSNLLFALWLDESIDAAHILAEHALWAARHADPLFKGPSPNSGPGTARLPRQINNPGHWRGEPGRPRPVNADSLGPNRPLRIGYVSPDLRYHSVGGFMDVVLENHHPKNVEVFCYSDLRAEDDLTRKLRQKAAVWRETSLLNSAQLAQQIRDDRIDILVDLALHTTGNRLLVFAQKPAPVQVTWLGYPGTTGLRAIDYRLTDAYLDPPAGPDAYAEKSLRLPHCFWCYRPIAQAPQVNNLPALAAGHVTFGCFNNFCKVSPAARQAWAQVLAGVPGSRLLLYSPDGAHRQKMRELFQRNGVDGQRIQFVAAKPHAEYFRQYQGVDIALDPFPFAGGTTTLDSLWMGVPVITLAGRTVAGRGGVSILSNLGLTQWIAKTPEDCIRIAINMAADLPRLAELRHNLRTMMQQSAITDGGRFVAGLEDAYRRMWTAWCDSKS